LCTAKHRSAIGNGDNQCAAAAYNTRKFTQATKRIAKILKHTTAEGTVKTASGERQAIYVLNMLKAEAISNPETAGKFPTHCKHFFGSIHANNVGSLRRQQAR
jgi:hypothetical protein